MVLYRPGLMACVDTVAISNVFPSGGAFATSAAPRLPPAPVLFSTRNVWPSNSVSLAAVMRATWSVGPPAAKDTTMRTGFDGYLSCASAGVAASTQLNTRPADVSSFAMSAPPPCQPFCARPRPDAKDDPAPTASWKPPDGKA